MRSCSKCSFWKNERCTDDEEFVDGDGTATCRYHSTARPIEEYRAKGQVYAVSDKFVIKSLEDNHD